ncbi:unnamed protein product [Discosporangium mesarthrocarpum]
MYRRIFSLPQNEPKADQIPQEWTLNLQDLAFSEDARPLMVGCTCPCCSSHSRAYVHHLLKTKDLLAQVLLQAHNIHHYLRFFQAIRESINKGRFGDFVDWMTQELHAPSPTTQENSIAS